MSTNPNNTEKIPIFEENDPFHQIFVSLQNTQTDVQKVEKSAFWFHVYVAFLTLLFFVLTLSLVVLDILIAMLMSNSLVW